MTFPRSAPPIAHSPRLNPVNRSDLEIENTRFKRFKAS